MTVRTNIRLRYRSAARPRGIRQGAGDMRHKAMVLLIPILATTLYVVLKGSMNAPASARAADKPHPAPTTPDRPAVEIAWTVPPVYELNGRDPMRLRSSDGAAAVYPAPTNVELLLTGILHSNDRATAIINTQVLYEGQQISGATVVKIGQDSVEFERNGARWRQTVGE